MIENVASEHLGLRLSHMAFEHWLRRLYIPETQKGLLGVLRGGDAAHGVQGAWDEVEHFYKRVRDWAKFDLDRNQQVVPEPLPVPTELPNLLGMCWRGWRVDRIRQGPVHESETQIDRTHCAGMRDELDASLKQALPEMVYGWKASGVVAADGVVFGAHRSPGRLCNPNSSSKIELCRVEQRHSGRCRRIGVTSKTVSAPPTRHALPGLAVRFRTADAVLLLMAFPSPTIGSLRRAVAKAVMFFAKTDRRAGPSFLFHQRRLGCGGWRTSCRLKMTAAPLAPACFRERDVPEVMLEKFPQGGP